VSFPHQEISRPTIPLQQKRRINPAAGRALEILGHAIEYLIDMHVHEGSLIVWEKGHFDAIEILKTLNRQIYEECPVVPTIEQRLRGLLVRKRV
jgi:hypothetical protein